MLNKESKINENLGGWKGNLICEKCGQELKLIEKNFEENIIIFKCSKDGEQKIDINKYINQKSKIIDDYLFCDICYKEKGTNFCRACGKIKCNKCECTEHENKISLKEYIDSEDIKANKLYQNIKILLNANSKYNNEINSFKESIILNKLILNLYEKNRNNIRIVNNIKSISKLNENNKIEKYDFLKKENLELQEKIKNIHNKFNLFQTTVDQSKNKIIEYKKLLNEKDINLKNIKKEYDFIKNEKIHLENKLKDLIKQDNIDIIKAEINKLINKNIEFPKNKIIYYIIDKPGLTQIFGKGFNNKPDFVSINKNKCVLLIDGELVSLDYTYYFKKEGVHKVELVEKVKITDFSYMFYEINKNVLKIKLSDDWDVREIKEMKSMFSCCTRITSIKFLIKWKVSNVINMKSMFSKCININDLEPLIDWDVSNVIDMSSMFAGLINIKNVNCLSKWNVKNVQNMNYMFSGCNKITYLNCLNKWDISNLISKDSIFGGIKEEVKRPFNFE